MDLASVAYCIVCVVDCACALALVVGVLAHVSCSVEGFVTSMAVLLAVLEVPFVNPKMVL